MGDEREETLFWRGGVAAEARTCNDPVARQQFKVTKPAAGRDAEARDVIIRKAVHVVGRILPRP